VLNPFKRVPRVRSSRQKLVSAWAWVVPLREAFLEQMNYFDRFLEFELRQMLDPVVNPEAPRRRRRKSTRSPLLKVVSAPIELAAEVLPTVKPVVVPVKRFRVHP
jgi:hypothetical protein